MPTRTHAGSHPHPPTKKERLLSLCAPALENGGSELGDDLPPVVKAVVKLRLEIPDHERVLDVLPDVIPSAARREHLGGLWVGGGARGMLVAAESRWKKGEGKSHAHVDCQGNPSWHNLKFNFILILVACRQQKMVSSSHQNGKDVEFMRAPSPQHEGHSLLARFADFRHYWQTFDYRAPGRNFTFTPPSRWLGKISCLLVRDQTADPCRLRMSHSRLCFPAPANLLHPQQSNARPFAATRLLAWIARLDITRYHRHYLLSRARCSGREKKGPPNSRQTAGVFVGRLAKAVHRRGRKLRPTPDWMNPHSQGES